MNSMGFLGSVLGLGLGLEIALGLGLRLRLGLKLGLDRKVVRIVLVRQIAVRILRTTSYYII